MFDISFETAVLRYYLMMFFVIIGLFTSPWIMALALPIFLSTILGVRFSFRKKNPKESTISDTIASMKSMPSQVRKAG